MRSSTILKGFLYGLTAGVVAYVSGNAGALIGVLTAAQATGIAAVAFAIGFSYPMAQDLEEETAPIEM